MEGKECLHCGTPVPAGVADGRFCCTGCAYVYELVHSEGLDQFYHLRGSQSLAPVSPQALRDRDYEWLEEMARDAEEKVEERGSATLRLAIQGISCMGCVWLMERVFQSMPGAVRLDIHAPRGELYVEWLPGNFDLLTFAQRLQQFGYLIGKPDEATASNVQSSSFSRRVGLCGAFAMNAMAFSLPSYLGMRSDFMFAPWFDIISACSATLALLVGGTYFAERSWRALRHGVLHMDTPITLGILAAWLGSMAGWLGDIPSLKYFDFVAIFIFLMLAGRWMQQSAVERNRRRLLQANAVPETVTRLDAANVPEKVRLESVAQGETIRIKPGEVCPVNGILLNETASLSLEWINGESAASRREQGQLIPSGALNIGTQTLDMTVSEAWTESLLYKLANSRESGSSATPAFANLLRVYLAAVTFIGIAGAFAWWWNGHGLAQALQVMISVFVVSCPCALGVAAPFADDLAASWMGRLGVFVRSHGLWTRLARVRKVVFDKTGTLTLENPSLQNPQVLRSLPSEARHALSHLVSSNLHPVSRSLFDALGRISDSARTFHEAVHEVIGQGLQFTDQQDNVWALGRPGWRGGLASQGTFAPEEGDAEFTKNGGQIATFAFVDALRPETVGACARLRRERYDLFLLSGDRREKVAQIARALSIPAANWSGEMTPSEKAARVFALNKTDTLYIGDGANDSLALEAALCGGSPVTGRNFLEHKADFYFLGNSLRFTATLLDVALRRQKAVRLVFIFALIYNLGAIALSLSGYMSPLLAAILMPLSSLVTLGIARMTFGRLQSSVGEFPQEEIATPQRMLGQNKKVLVS